MTGDGEAAERPAGTPDRDRQTAPADRVTWIGHATALIELGGRRILTDPLLRRRPYHLVRRVPAPDRALLRSLDAVLISHLHFDHLDLPSLRRIGTGVPVLAPRGTGTFLRNAGLTDVTELSVGDSSDLGGVTVTATAAAHDGRRRPGGLAAPPLGFVLEAERRVYFAGDTDLFADMAELAALELDMALLPIAGWGPKLGPGHLDAPRAAAAAALIRPQLVVPIHWGTYFPVGMMRRAGAAFEQPPHEFAEAMGRLAPTIAWTQLDPGGSALFSGGGAGTGPGTL